MNEALWTWEASLVSISGFGPEESVFCNGGEIVKPPFNW
jgi:hypothetical protein